MKTFLVLTKRNIKLFFKDKGMFFVSMITPMIILVLYATFLAKVYKDSFLSAIPSFFDVPEKLIDGAVAGQLLSSLLAVVPITVAFNSNMRIVQDRMAGVNKDLLVTPVNRSVLALSYFFATLATTLIVCYAAMAVGLGYVAIKGWYMSFGEVMLVALDVLILSIFGTAFSSIISIFLNTQGQMSAVCTIVSAGYGFICGAYMPISGFGTAIQKIVSFLPGTYGTALLRNHTLNGAFSEMSGLGFPEEAINGIRDGVDCNLYFFDKGVEQWVMYLVIALSCVLLIGIYLLLNFLLKRKQK